MPRTNRPITSYPLRVRRTVMFKEPKCAECRTNIAFGQRYYGKGDYSVHEGCAKERSKNNK